MSCTIICDDALSALRKLPSGSVHVSCTSPPYFGLRAYQSPDVVFGGAEGCQHEWAQHIRPAADGTLTLDGNSALRAGHQGDKSATMKPTVSAFCSKCNAWRGQLGSEPTIDLYVAHLVEIFREVRRVLHPQGTLFLNLGDSYCSTAPATRNAPMFKGSRDYAGQWANWRPETPVGLKPKDLCLIPFRVALALQADGWYLRSVIPWLKQSAMPESVTDRPTNAIEYWFMLSPSARYYWDAEAVRIASATNDPRKPYGSDGAWAMDGRDKWECGAGKPQNRDATTRNRRNSDWLFESFQGLIVDDLGGPLCMLVNPEGYDAEYCRACQRYYDGPDKKLIRIERVHDVTAPPPGKQAGTGNRTYTGFNERWDESEGKPAKPRERRICLCGRHDAWLSHYATFPEKAIAPFVLGATSEKGCCAKCGTPWRRVVEKTGRMIQQQNGPGKAKAHIMASGPHGSTSSLTTGFTPEKTTVGWRPGCACDAPVGLRPDDLETIESPLCRGEDREDPSLEVGRAGYSRPRREDEGSYQITRYEQRGYAAQLKTSDHRAEMEAEAGPAFAHYLRTDSSGARPIPPDLLETWVERGWLARVQVPSWTPTEPVPCTILDLFSGTGTTGVVAERLGRNAVLIEVSPDYAVMSRKRLEAARRQPVEEQDEALPLFSPKHNRALEEACQQNPAT